MTLYWKKRSTDTKSINKIEHHCNAFYRWTKKKKSKIFPFNKNACYGLKLQLTTR